MSIREISTELQKKAEDDLNEVPGRIQEDLKHVREWLAKQPHINARTDDQWLLTFLRGCKFSLERTKEKLDTFYTMRTLLPEFFSNRDPFSPEIQEVLSLGPVLPLRNTADSSSPRVLLMRNAVSHPDKINIIDLIRTNMMISDVLLIEDDQSIIAGQCVLQDMKDTSVGHMLQLSPSLAKKSTKCFLDAYPIRPQGMHFVNIPSFFEAMYSIVKPFFTDKLKSRIKVHTGNNLDDLYESIPQSILPNEYGGQGGSLAELTAEWKKKVESYRSWFIEDEKYCTNEVKRPGKPKSASELFGVEGSFRKLTVD